MTNRRATPLLMNSLWMKCLSIGCLSLAASTLAMAQPRNAAAAAPPPSLAPPPMAPVAPRPAATATPAVPVAPIAPIAPANPSPGAVGAVPAPRAATIAKPVASTSGANALIAPAFQPVTAQPAGTSASAAAVPAAAALQPPLPAPAAGGAPKPAPELDQMKVLQGTWRCDGRAPASATGPEHAYKSSWKFKRDLDNFWWAAEYQQLKGKSNPAPMKARGYMTYDPAAKAFVLVGVDNMGGSSTESTTGWSGDVVTLAGDASMAGKKIPYREVITKKGTHEFTWRGELKMGGDWVTLGEDRCKK